jgi:hypothetical protein
LNKGLLTSLTDFIHLRKNQLSNQKPGGTPEQTSLKFYSMYLNMDRMLQKLPDRTVERLNLKFQQMIHEELDLEG